MDHATPAMDKRWTDRTPDGGLDEGAVDWISASAAAAMLGVSQRTIRRAIARGELPAAKHAGVYRIATADLTRYQAQGRPSTRSPTRIHPSAPRLIPFPKPEVETGPDLPRPLTLLIGRER